MKGLRYLGNRSMDYAEVPDIVLETNTQVVVAVDASGICGSDMHVYRGHGPTRPVPAILGHEAAGRIVTGPRAGQAVAINPLIPCGNCRYCHEQKTNLCSRRRLIGLHLPGTFADQVIVPANNLLPIPMGLAAQHAALAEPAATALHGCQLGIRGLAKPLHQGQILVIGAGSIGLLSALVLRARGALAITIAETNNQRRTTAARAGDWQLIDGLKTTATADTFDLVVDAVGSRASRDVALQAVCAGGVVVHLGLEDKAGVLDMHCITRQEITLIGSYTYTPAELADALDQLHSGALGHLSWVETRALSDGPRVFQDLDAGHSTATKIVLIP